MIVTMAAQIQVVVSPTGVPVRNKMVHSVDPSTGNLLNLQLNQNLFPYREAGSLWAFTIESPTTNHLLE